MTPTDMPQLPQLVGAAWSAVATHVRDLLVEPSSRTHWLGLLVSACIVACLVACGRHRLQLRHVAERAWGRSARVDYALLVTRPLLTVACGVPLTLSSLSVAVAVTRAGRDLLGDGRAHRLADALWNAPSSVVVPLYTAVLFVSWDFSRFALHVLMHRVDALWQLHQVHHSATTLTPFTLYRVHPVEAALYAVRGVLVTGLVLGVFSCLFGARVVQLELLGVNAIGWLLSVTIGNLRHSHVWWSFGPAVERWLISPAQHQLHHRRGALATVNYGTWLAVWDRAYRSLVVTRQRAPTPGAFGLHAHAQNHDETSAVSALIDPCVASLRAFVAVARKRLGAVLPT